MTPERDQAVLTAIRNVEAGVKRISKNDSQDIVQEAITRAIRHGVDCDAEAWLRTVSKRIAIDRARKSREYASGGTDELDRLGTASPRTPEDVVVGNETFGVVRKALNSLPPRYRDALLAYIEEQETEGVAKRFGISPNATWSLLCRARARLREELDRVGYAFGFVGIKLQRWQGEVATAGAAMTIAAAVVLSSSPTPAAVPPRASIEPKLTTASVTTTVPKAVASTAPAAEVDVKAPVEAPKKVLKAVAKPIASYSVQPCGPGGKPLPLGVKVQILEDERESILGRVIKQLPEPLRIMEATGCRD